ncbi:transposase [Comamonas aquatica]|nr:transposase [Comamonas aquatica]MDH1766941.1 transposase [Comamonas aquatica]
MTTKKHEVPEELLAKLLADYKKPEDLIGENGLLKQLTKLLVEKALDAELTEHLGHDRHEPVVNTGGNTRNGKSRKVIYTTNAIESVNMGLRKLSKNRGSFPSDEALTKLFYLALRNISQKWTMPIRDWKAALTRFTIQFGDRISVN